MDLGRRSFLVAGGVGAVSVAGVALGTRPATALRSIDVGVVPDNPAEALDNTKVINAAIEANPVDTRFVLPAGQIFLAHDPPPPPQAMPLT